MCFTSMAVVEAAHCSDQRCGWFTASLKHLALYLFYWFINLPSLKFDLRPLSVATADRQTDRQTDRNNSCQCLGWCYQDDWLEVGQCVGVCVCVCVCLCVSWQMVFSWITSLSHKHSFQVRVMEIMLSVKHYQQTAFLHPASLYGFLHFPWCL